MRGMYQFRPAGLAFAGFRLGRDGGQAVADRLRSGFPLADDYA